MKLHIQERKQCAICEDLFGTEDPVVALYGDKYSFRYAGQTAVFPFRSKYDDGLVDSSDAIQYCRILDICKTCTDFDTPEYVSVHADCFEIFFGRYKDMDTDSDIKTALDRLWLLTAWRFPFRAAFDINLREADITAIDVVAAAAVADRCISNGGEMYKRLAKLPTELIYAIHGFCHASSFWRLVRAAALADKAYSMTTSPMKFERLDSVVSWSRGDALPVLEESGHDKPNRKAFWLRVTTERDGIVKIERLSHMPQYQAPVNKFSRYAVFACNQKEKRSEYVMLRNGHIRLFLNKKRPRIRFWNTPGPPNSKGSRIISWAFNTWTRDNVIELDRTVRGITFFFYTRHSLCDFHIHRRESPNALSTYKKLPPIAHKDVYWIYFPVSPEDEVTGYGSMWVYGSFAAVIRTRLTGDNFTMSGILSDDDILSVDWMNFDAPTTLVYSEHLFEDQIDILNLYNPDVEGIPQQLVKSKPPAVQACVEPTIEYFSTSPLDNVVSATIYYIDDTDFCRGIVFGYVNGGQRAIGECRLGKDRSQKTENPKYICFKQVAYIQLPDMARLSLSDSVSEPETRRTRTCRTRVVFTADGVAALQEEQWQCYPMRGVVRLWFDHASHYMKVDDE